MANFAHCFAHRNGQSSAFLHQPNKRTTRPRLHSLGTSQAPSQASTAV